ncbi:5-formyltetrahydrofolate cyclo-ligase [Arachnia propionica]|uniref:5-formyltetrahydrofolate cyclo-ligase n=1 Tax=Arachnia propionica TaxID=1750 RepID=A0A3P1T726_9ACTN|nr:5-formyltetrahydrofolate cyclo-ligase [Arachnia propionica]RRD05130.1 5-formyltetrahydrofolate cyclo-ligase [Arachnia propionica]
MNSPADKGALRRAKDAARHQLPPHEHRRRDAARTDIVLDHLPRPGVVALYAARPAEPGTGPLVTAMEQLGWRVLLPKLGRSPDWAWATRPLRLGWAGIPEPTGPALGADALALADLLILPALAVAPGGARLGTGGGWYDRALPHARPGVPRWVLVNDDEVLARLPTEPHDLPVDVAVTETGFTQLAHRDVS